MCLITSLIVNHKISNHISFIEASHSNIVFLLFLQKASVQNAIYEALLVSSRRNIGSVFERDSENHVLVEKSIPEIVSKQGISTTFPGIRGETVPRSYVYYVFCDSNPPKTNIHSWINLHLLDGGEGKLFP